MADDKKPPPIWETSILSSALCDAFLEGNRGVAQPDSFLEACITVETLLESRAQLHRYQSSLLPAVKTFTQICQRFLRLRSVEKKSQAEALEKLVEETVEALITLTSSSKGKFWLIPGGWTSSTSGAFGVVHLLALNRDGETYSFITCNPSSSVFHPCQPATNSSKIMYKAALRLGGIPKEEVTNTAFWMMLFSQSLTASEFHREEILYDVLLPSLTPSGQLADAAATAINDEGTEWRTPQRTAASSYWKSLLLGLRVILREDGASLREVKRFSLAMKYEIMCIASEQIKSVMKGQLPRDKATLLRHACSTLASGTLKALDKEVITAAESTEMNLLIENVLNDTESAEATPTRVGPEGRIIEAFTAAGSAKTFPVFCVERKEDEKLAGLVTDEGSGSQHVAQESVPKRAETVEDAVGCLVECESFINALASSGEGGGMVSASYTSRVAVDRMIIAQIRSCLIRTMRMPLPLTSSSHPLRNTERCLWSAFPSRDLQLTCLAVLHRLMLAYGDAWQSVDDASRALESERCIVALALFSIFDRVVRVQEQGLALALLLAEDGGIAISTSLCIGNLSLFRVAATMEVNDPGLGRLRSTCLSYVRSVERCCSRTDLFVFRMPTDKIEVKKYSTTVMLLRRVLEQFGYPLFGTNEAEGMEDEQPEMELLMQWLMSNNTMLARDHPEWPMLRDVALLFKYLATMETRQSELMRQRIPVSEYQSWALTFGDGRIGQGNGTSDIANRSSGLVRGMGFGRRRRAVGRMGYGRAGGLSWEVMGYRGQELDIADVEVSGFGGRKVFFGEGPVVHSPADVSALLSLSVSLGLKDGQAVTEDDVLHCADLPSFDNTLSHQEAETLMSYLTVPYLRIPLVLGFFAAGDRVTYLVSSPSTK